MYISKQQQTATKILRQFAFPDCNRHQKIKQQQPPQKSNNTRREKTNQTTTDTKNIERVYISKHQQTQNKLLRECTFPNNDRHQKTSNNNRHKKIQRTTDASKNIERMYISKQQQTQ